MAISGSSSSCEEEDALIREGEVAVFPRGDQGNREGDGAVFREHQGLEVADDDEALRSGEDADAPRRPARPD